MRLFANFFLNNFIYCFSVLLVAATSIIANVVEFYDKIILLNSPNYLEIHWVCLEILQPSNEDHIIGVRAFFARGR